MSSSPFRLPCWDDVKAERQRQRRQHKIAGESSIDLSTSSSAVTDVVDGRSKYDGKAAPTDFERLRDSDLFLDTHSQASLRAHFSHPSPTRGPPYVGRYDRYLRSRQSNSEDDEEQELEAETGGENQGKDFSTGVNRDRRRAQSRKRDADAGEVHDQNYSDDDSGSFQADLEAIDIHHNKGFTTDQQKTRLQLKKSSSSPDSNLHSKAFMETISLVESSHHNRLISQFQDILRYLQRLSKSIDSTSEIDRGDLQALQSLPSQWKGSFEKSFPNDILKSACYSLENIATMELDDLELAANDKNYQCFHEILVSIKSSEQSLSSVPLAISQVLELVLGSFESHKRTYLSRIKVMQETANISASNIIQAERAKAAQMMKQVELQQEELKRSIHEEHRSKHKEKDEKIASLEEKLENTVEKFNQLMRGESILDFHGVDMLSKRDEAVRTKCEEACTKEFARKLEIEMQKAARELEQTQLNLQDEIERNKRDYSTQIQDIHDEYEASMRSQAKDESQLRETLRGDKDKLREEIETLKKEIVGLNDTVASERRVTQTQKEIEKDRHERELMDVHSTAMKDVAKTKAELAEIVRKQQKELSELRVKLEEAPARERAILTKAHAIEVQNLTQHAKGDLDRALTHKDVKHQEEMSSMRHLHEAEMKRVLRESERLKRIIARAGGMSNIISSSAAVSTYMDESRKSGYILDDPDPEPSKIAPVPTPSPRVSLDGFNGSSIRSTESDDGDSIPKFWSGSTLLQHHQITPDTTATTLGEQEFRLHMLDDTMFTKNVGERERLYFTELQDYLEEENENEETTKESQEKRKQSLSPSKKFDTRRESLEFDPAVNRWKDNFSSEPIFESDVHIGDEEIIKLSKLKVHDSLTIGNKLIEFVLKKGEVTKSMLEVANTTVHPFVVKVKTTKPSLYSVKPNQTCINPGEVVSIEVTLIQREAARILDAGPAGVDVSNHIFLLESKAITLNVARELTILTMNDSHCNSKSNELAERSRVYEMIWNNGGGSDTDNKGDDQNLKKAQIGVRYKLDV